VTAKKRHFYFPGFVVSMEANSTFSKYPQHQHPPRKALREIQRAEFWVASIDRRFLLYPPDKFFPEFPRVEPLSANFSH
jgi:hypothetical protein